LSINIREHEDRTTMWTLLLWLACSNAPSSELPPEGVLARDKMARSLQTRDPTDVSLSAKEASVWEGKDPALDRLLGDALANVLMHPDDGLRLLEANPSPTDPEWVTAHLAAAMRSGKPESMNAAWDAAGHSALNFKHPVVHQIMRRMLADPQISPDMMVDAITRCSLLDSQPRVGRKPLDQMVNANLLKVATMVGATQIVLGRPQFRGDPEPTSNRGPLFCTYKVLIDEWPTPLPKTMSVGLTDGVNRVFIDIKSNNGEPWAFASSDSQAAGRWIEATQLLETPDGEKTIRERYAEGLWNQ
jgi:hypothetical protein